MDAPPTTNDLRTIANHQRGILMCILAYFGLVVAQFVVPPDSRIFLLYAGGVLSLTATVFVFLLATKVSGTAGGILLALLTLIPCVGLIALLIVNGKATNILKANGIHVGLLGARGSDIK